jgi:hypothetical protein
MRQYCELRHVHDTVFGFGLMFEAYDDYTRIILDHGVYGFIDGGKFRLGFVYRLSLNIHDMHYVLPFPII